MAVMQSSDSRKGDHASDGGSLDGALERRVVAEGHAEAIRVVVARLLTDQPQHLPLTQSNNVVQKLSASVRPSEPFCHGDRGAMRNGCNPKFGIRASNAAP
jgi:hypothetical protein